MLHNSMKGKFNLLDMKGINQFKTNLSNLLIILSIASQYFLVNHKTGIILTHSFKVKGRFVREVEDARDSISVKYSMLCSDPEIGVGND